MDLLLCIGTIFAPRKRFFLPHDVAVDAQLSREERSKKCFGGDPQRRGVRLRVYSVAEPPFNGYRTPAF